MADLASSSIFLPRPISGGGTNPSGGGGSIGTVQKGLGRLAAQSHFDFSRDDQLQRGLNGVVLCQTWDPSFAVNTTDYITTFVDSQINMSAILVPEPMVTTGVAFNNRTAGVFTGDNNNVVGLYRIDDGGTLYEKQFATASDPTGLYKAGAYVQKAWSGGPYTIEAGIYWIAWLANWSAVTTAPTIMALTSISGAYFPFGTPSTGLRTPVYSSPNTNLPATLTMSSATSGLSIMWGALY